MSTEQKPATEPKAEPNALAAALSDSWEKFKQGKLLSYPMMAILLLLVAGIGITVYIVSEKRKAESARWTELDNRYSIKSLEEFVEKPENAGSIQAKLAKLEIARAQLGPNGIDMMSAAVPNDLDGSKTTELRKTAVQNIEKSREDFTKLVDEFKDDPILRTICLLGVAKAEAALVGMPKEGQLEQFRGDPKKAIEWLDKVAEAAPETEWAKDAKRLADTLRNQNTQQQVVTLQASVYSIPMPSLPKFPNDGFHGLPPFGS